jgi:hypothetical protein
MNKNGTINTVSTPGHTGDVTQQLLANDFTGTGSMYMIRSDVYESIGGFDERFPAWVDWEQFENVTGQRPVVHLSKTRDVRDERW